MKKKTKRIIMSCVSLMLAFICLFGILYAQKAMTAQAMTSGVSQGSQPISVTQVLQSTASLRVTPTGITAYSDTEKPPSSLQERKLYDADGKEIRLIRETGQLITEDGKLLYNPDNLAMGLYNEITQELYDAANKALTYWYNSVSMQYDIGSGGGKTLTTVKAGDKIYIATILDKKDNLIKTLYVKMEKFETNWWDRLNPFSQSSFEYKYFDMLGREIPVSWFIDQNRAVWLPAAARTAVTLGLTIMACAAFGGKIGLAIGATVAVGIWLYGVFKGFDPIQSVNLIEAGTVGEAVELIQMVSHPWEKIEGVLTANDSGEFKSGIYINPANNQLCDSLGRPIYQLDSGLPVVYDQKNSQVITVPNKQVQTIRGGILENCATVEFLRKLNFNIYFHFIDDPEFGILNTIVLRKGDKWFLPNGDEATDIVRPDVGINEDGEQFSLKSLFQQFGKLFGDSFGTVIAIIIIVLLLIFCFPLVVQIITLLIKLIIGMVKGVVKAISKAFGGKK
ncbi:MAG: hypothetical protein FWH03_00785 [Firmicutes bacterium]|nr:hypothetical protein [Bacillota bacterium]